ncbi:hypothetical protein F511_20936 [Dorcoceras hygrometricum]|uniref:Uncharacterized protein n=1 Tax=Dorcoceras hygrometricum TaxID=472368 RepID=A0A2Z7BFE6_9LAMI|nr:hypothetical protein F511_20936 [Dorcoceras hygrometricum]
MVKLASAREIRTYGPRRARERSEYINAGLYVFATIVLACGIATQWSTQATSGLVLVMIALVIILLVNVHDFAAHIAGVDYRLPLLEHDLQFALVELAAPLVFAIGTLLLFLASLFLFIQAVKGYGYSSFTRHALNMLIAGPVLWLLGSIHNSCQIYERADGLIQILQQSVHIPFLLASLLFLVGGIINSREKIESDRPRLDVLGETWIWLSLFGSILLFVGGVANVLKVYQALRGTEPRLEKLRGGAEERLRRIREGKEPLLGEEQQRPASKNEEHQRPISKNDEHQRPISKNDEHQRPISKYESQPRESQVPQVREEQWRQQRPAAEEGKSTPYKDVLVA